MGDLSMIIITEELSAASLAAAGSLSTRPEILTKALLAGGTEDQRKEWLPKIAAGDVLVAIAVTEPDTGSDVSALQTKAEPSELNGQKGWKINGAKAWSTFSGRANVLALLARTDPDMSKGAKGLSLFIVPKDSFGDEEKWEFKQESGGVIQGTNNPTPGYLGIHSYSLAIEDMIQEAKLNSRKAYVAGATGRVKDRLAKFGVDVIGTRKEALTAAIDSING